MKNKGGRPLKFKSVEELQKKIDAYFEKCDNRKMEVFDKVNGGVITISNPEVYTVSGLADFLGTNRETLLDYQNNRGDKFSDTIKKAKSKIEYNVELLSLESGKPVGAIFNLKNNFPRWKEKTETELSGKLDIPQALINVIKTSKEKE